MIDVDVDVLSASIIRIMDYSPPIFMRPSDYSHRILYIFFYFFISFIKLYFQAHMQTITKAQRTHSIALHSWAI